MMEPKLKPMKPTKAYKANDGTLFEDMGLCITHNAELRYNEIVSAYRNSDQMVEMLAYNADNPKFMAALEAAHTRYQASLDE